MPEATETAKNGIFSSALIACTTWVSHFGWHGEMNKVYSDTQISNNVHLNLGQISHSFYVTLPISTVLLNIIISKKRIIFIFLEFLTKS